MEGHIVFNKNHNCLCIEGPSKRNEYKSQDLLWLFKIVFRSEIWHNVALEKKRYELKI